MSRRRYISTEISLDPAVNRVAKQSDFAALLYTWMIPHASDDATITGDPEKLLMLVAPGRRDKDPNDVEAALALLDAEGLFELWSRATATIYLWPEAFYRYQTYIKPSNRRVESASTADQRKTPQNTASLSPSLSPSHSPSRSAPVESVDCVDNPPRGVRAAALPGPSEQSGSFRRAGDVLATMGVGSSQSGVSA
jgi:hypothetical protein